MYGLVLNGFDPWSLFFEVSCISLIVVFSVRKERRCVLVVMVLQVRVVKGAQNQKSLAISKLRGV